MANTKIRSTVTVHSAIDAELFAQLKNINRLNHSISCTNDRTANWMPKNYMHHAHFQIAQLSICCRLQNACCSEVTNTSRSQCCAFSHRKVVFVLVNVHSILHFLHFLGSCNDCCAFTVFTQTATLLDSIGEWKAHRHNRARERERVKHAQGKANARNDIVLHSLLRNCIGSRNCLPSHRQGATCVSMRFIISNSLFIFAQVCITTQLLNE